MISFREVARIVAKLNRAIKVLSQRKSLHARIRDLDGKPDLEWWHPDGRAPSDADWHDHAQAMGVIVRASAETIRDSGAPEVFVCYNAGPARQFVLPEGKWVLLLDSANPGAPEKPVGKSYTAAEQSVLLFAHPDPSKRKSKES